MYAPHVSNLSHLDASRRYRQTPKLDAITNKRTNKHTNSFTDKVKVEWDEPRAIQKRLVYQMPVQGRRTTLLDAITQAHSTAHMQQNATRIIPLPNSLLPGTCFFIHFWTCTSSTVSQSVFWVFFLDLVFFVATKYRLSYGFILGLIFIQSLVVLELTHSLGYLQRELSWPRGRILGFGCYGCVFELVLFFVELWFHLRTRFSL
jgi:hypothetical protein